MWLFSYNPCQSNWMLGPSAYTMIQMGCAPIPSLLNHRSSRFVPCMKPTEYANVTGAVFRCTSSETTNCDLAGLCGMGGFGVSGKPHQWFRFLTAPFLHAGVLHALLNLQFLWYTGADLERVMGFLRYTFVYTVSAVGGFLFGGLFSPLLQPSVGCSGGIMGLSGVLLVDLLAKRKAFPSAAKWGCGLAGLVVSIVLTFVLGLLPGVDNFSHVGGFILGTAT